MAGKSKKQDVAGILAQHRLEQATAKEVLEFLAKHSDKVPREMVGKMTILAEAVLK